MRPCIHVHLYLTTRPHNVEHESVRKFDEFTVKLAPITLSLFFVSFARDPTCVPFVPDNTGAAIHTKIWHAEFG